MTESKATWAVVEQMGHVRFAGRVEEITVFGATMGRCLMPLPDGTFRERLFAGSSLYAVTPCTEEEARAICAHGVPEPVKPWEMPKALPAAAPSVPREIFYGDDLGEEDRFELGPQDEAMTDLSPPPDPPPSPTAGGDLTAGCFEPGCSTQVRFEGSSWCGEHAPCLHPECPNKTGAGAMYCAEHEPPQVPAVERAPAMVDDDMPF